MPFQHTETVTTGLSYFHKLVLAVLKTAISKKKPGEIHYRNYKKFDSLKFNVDLENVFTHEKIESYIKFDKVFMKVLNRHAPFKNKILRASHSSYVSKTFRKAIIRRSYLDKKYFWKEAGHCLTAYKKRKNYCSRLYKKERKKFFDGLNPSFVTGNKLFWKTVKPFFSGRGNYGANIKLVEEEEVLQNDREITKKLRLVL